MRGFGVLGRQYVMVFCQCSSFQLRIARPLCCLTTIYDGRWGGGEAPTSWPQIHTWTRAISRISTCAMEQWGVAPRAPSRGPHLLLGGGVVDDSLCRRIIQHQLRQYWYLTVEQWGGGVSR